MSMPSSNRPPVTLPRLPTVPVPGFIRRAVSFLARLAGRIVGMILSAILEVYLGLTHRVARIIYGVL
ncbi:MAG: hypothetical protein B7Y84_13580, partial [Azorhizobium sp. 32-67-21]